METEPRFRRKRLYEYGVIVRAIRNAFAGGATLSPFAIAELCPHIDATVLLRNVRALCSQGELTNVGTRKAALYRWTR